MKQERCASESSIDQLLRAQACWVDLRSPAEFSKGSVPGAINLPILTDDERHMVGVCYREKGQEAAVALGTQLVQGAVKEARIAGWQRLLQARPDAALFCWRGGQRTGFATRWLQERGLQARTVQGGYKALRNRCLQILDVDSQRLDWFVLGGRTGVGKTLILQQLQTSIDLEGFARHRGSAFGATQHPQPTQVDFENALAVASLQHLAEHSCLVVEDESRTVGKVALPGSWHQRMQRAPLVLLEASLEQRATHIANEYVVDPLAQGMSSQMLEAKYVQAVARIRKRLGGDRHKAVQAAITNGFENNDHLTWIRLLLNEYYDPMYDYQLAHKQQRVVFRGNAEQVLGWLRDAADGRLAQDARG
ncbi:MAG: tRNA 2-selenouridine(34) synthase MnmH [Pseudomonadales bacterium]